MPPTLSPASVRGWACPPGRQTLHNKNVFSFKPQRLTRLEHGPTIGPQPHFPPSFNPITCTAHKSFLLLAQNQARLEHPKHISNSTSAASQHSFSLSAAKRTQTPSLPSFSMILAQTPSPGPPIFRKILNRTPQPGLPDRAKSMPPDVTVPVEQI